MIISMGGVSCAYAYLLEGKLFGVGLDLVGSGAGSGELGTGEGIGRDVSVGVAVGERLGD